MKIFLVFLLIDITENLHLHTNILLSLLSIEFIIYPHILVKLLFILNPYFMVGLDTKKQGLHNLESRNTHLPIKAVYSVVIVQVTTGFRIIVFIK